MLDNLNFHHIGIAVKEFDQAVSYYQSLGYKKQNHDIVRDELQRVDLILLKHITQPDVELVRPIDEKSPINNYIKNSDAVMYHTCYEVESFSRVINELKKNFRVFNVSKPKPAILFNNRLVSFYYIYGVGLIELLKSRDEV
jgi:methylmalonyl-CoA/ethylmalonyl-CoA epimerase